MKQMTGKDLKDLRNQYNVIQHELAEFLGYVTNGEPNRSMISRLENGHSKISHRLALAIESYFMSFNK